MPSPQPIIAFGQQPCGFFPKRFLVAKIFTARKLQQQLGGEIVFFYHDADHDPRETKTTLRHRQSHAPVDYNFEIENKIQRKFSPLFLKHVAPAWSEKMTRTLPNYVAAEWVDAFKNIPCTNVADFCLDMLRAMGLLEGVRIVRSGDPAVRNMACTIHDYFIDVPYQNQIVRARLHPATPGAPDGNPAPSLSLHQGGDSYITLPIPPSIEKSHITPTRDTRLRWMQSVIHCTHYIAGAGEQAYLNKSDAPEITFVQRDQIDRLDEAWTELP